MKDQIEEIRKQLQSFVRDKRTAEEKCKILSLGDDCKCPLCLIDNLVNFKLKQADVSGQSELLVNFIQWLQKEYEVQEVYEMYADEYLQEKLTNSH
jgi:hypothetical protein